MRFWLEAFVQQTMKNVREKKTAEYLTVALTHRSSSFARLENSRSMSEIELLVQLNTLEWFLSDQYLFTVERIYSNEREYVMTTRLIGLWSDVITQTVAWDCVKNTCLYQWFSLSFNYFRLCIKINIVRRAKSILSSHRWWFMCRNSTGSEKESQAPMSQRGWH